MLRLHLRDRLYPACLVLVLGFAPLSVIHAQPQCAYVISENGLNVRIQPSLESTILRKLSFGEAVEVTSDTMEGGWIEIAQYSTEEPYYVSSAYLSPHMPKVPEAALYGINHIIRGEWDLYYSPQPKHQCPAYYENIERQKRVSNQRDYDKKAAPEVMEMLNPKLYFHLTLVNPDDYRDKALKNPYSVDTTGASLYQKLRQNSKGFYLPIANGKDSVHVEDYDGEGYISRSYVGQIHPLNAYVIDESYEETTTVLINRTTGEKQTLVAGLPFISPNGDYVLGFDHPLTYTRHDVTTVQLLYRSQELEGKPSVICGFKSWQMFEKDLFGFWVSESELIVRVFPVDQLRGSYPRPENRAYQYLKITIL